jgi:TorA maturation chaperone TorD
MDQLLARANVYGICAMAFAFMDEDTVKTVREQSGDLIQVLQEAGVDPDALAAGQAFSKDLFRMSSAELIRGCNELFVGRQQCRLDESEYDKNIFYRHQRIADVSGFYKAFGFERAEELFQRFDFVGTELEFMCLLLLKRAYAIEHGMDDQADICAEAETKFFNEHLEWWIPTMCEKLLGADTCGFYPSLSSFLNSFIVSESSKYLQPA